MCGHKRSDSIVADFCDSEHAISHPLWGDGDPHALTNILMKWSCAILLVQAEKFINRYAL